MQEAIGVDLGGSHVMAVVVREDGSIGERHERDITDRRFEAVIDALDDVVSHAKKDAKGKVTAVGIGSPGNIDAKTGTILYSPNFGWTDVPLGAAAAKASGLPVFVGNDARCATLGEYTFGSGKDVADFVLLTLGTGIGGGIVLGGHLALGNRMGAGEVGHHQIRPTDGFVCACGKIGCFEAQASGTGLLRHAYALAPSFPRSTLLDAPRESIGSKQIRKAAQNGDPHALATWKRYIADLALGLANVIAFVNPAVIALGGGVSKAGNFMIDAVLPIVDELTTMVPRGTTRIVEAQLQNDAGAVGAATMALRGGLTTGKALSVA